MKLPDRINSDAELEDILAQPSDSDLESISRLRGDVLILGASGKIGPSLARRVQRAVTQTGSASRVMAASRFSSPGHDVACWAVTDPVAWSGDASAAPAG